MRKIDKIALIYIRNNKVLATLAKGKDKYYMPGGKRELGESNIDTLCREIKEELSVDINRDTVRLYGIFEAQADDKEETFIKISCYTGEYQGILKANSEIERYDWLKYEDIDKVSAFCKLIFEDLLKKGYLKEDEREEER